MSDDTPLFDGITVEQHDLQAINRKLDTILKEIRTMSADQDKLTADVQAINDGLSTIESEIAALKNQPPAAALDFTGLDAAVARIKGDAAPTPPAAA